MRIVLLLALMLAGCGPATTDSQALAKLEADQRRAAEENGKIECAPRGATAFARNCTLDRESGPSGLILVAHQPDGGFHRLLVTRDGRGVIAADGAERAVVSIVGNDQIEVAIGGDRYRLPATVKGKAAKAPQ